MHPPYDCSQTIRSRKKQAGDERGDGERGDDHEGPVARRCLFRINLRRRGVGRNRHTHRRGFRQLGHRGQIGDACVLRGEERLPVGGGKLDARFAVGCALLALMKKTAREAS